MMNQRNLSQLVKATALAALLALSAMSCSSNETPAITDVSEERESTYLETIGEAPFLSDDFQDVITEDTNSNTSSFDEVEAPSYTEGDVPVNESSKCGDSREDLVGFNPASEQVETFVAEYPCIG
tara:strand:- start:257 stop:631 length:375 start_codon:yes stop_codon:yes gene_type:complete